MLKISESGNENYLAQVVKLQGVRMHEDAHSLQCVNINFQNVITGMTAKDGDIYVYFPVGCAINKEYLAASNSFRTKELNADSEQQGYFDDNGRVKPTKLRGEKSCGYIVPAADINEFFGCEISEVDAGTTFDTIGSTQVCEKYIVKTKTKGMSGGKQGKEPKVSRIIDGQVHLHVSTSNLRQNAHKIKPNSLISVTYKTHGTSWWTSNVKVKKPLTWKERLLKKLGFNIVDEEYDLVYGSRKVVKNKSLDDPKQKDHYYGYDLWEDIKNEVGHTIPKGFTLYGECLGYDKNGGAIQGEFDYGCVGNEHKLEVYRITQTNPDGLVTELDLPQRMEFCEKAGLNPPHLFYYGKAKDMFPELDLDDHWNENFVLKLQDTYNEKDCFMCANKVPEEGIVVRIEDNLFDCEAYKLKSFRFLGIESDEQDKGISNIEDEN
ncbi:MAG: hypothetical protein PQJ49_01455 [Sphaerochaetaceae bacterium]|nr:hypothetical protein [Sphaerochaetaceae bacterium]